MIKIRETHKFSIRGASTQSNGMDSSSPNWHPGTALVNVINQSTEKRSPARSSVELGSILGKPYGRSEMGGWAKFADGRPVDTLALPLLADSFPPPIFNAGIPLKWVPTIGLTAHIHKRPAPGWIGEWFT